MMVEVGGVDPSLTWGALRHWDDRPDGEIILTFPSESEVTLDEICRERRLPVPSLLSQAIMMTTGLCNSRFVVLLTTLHLALDF
jgi:hypothetical protein